MITETYNLTNENVTLTTYILDTSFDHKSGYKRPAILIFPGGGYSMCSNREGGLLQCTSLLWGITFLFADTR